MEIQDKPLGRAASTLLVGYTRHGPEFAALPVEDQMSALGFTNRGVFFKARAELVDAGIAEYKRDGKRGTLTLSHDFIASLTSSISRWGVVGGYVPFNYIYCCCLEGSCTRLGSELNGRVIREVPDLGTSEINTSLWEVPKIGTSEVPEIGTSVGEVPDLGTSGIDELWGDVPETGTSHEDPIQEVPKIGASQINPTIGEVPNSGTSLPEQMEQVDAMDDTGPETSRSSPFALRRAAQVKLIKKAWPTIFPQDYPVSQDNAKTFLSWSENSALTCYERLQEVARAKPDMDHPIAYLRKALKNWGADRGTKGPQSIPSQVGAVGRPTRGAAAYVLGGDLPLPSEEYLEELREARVQADNTRKERGWED